MAEKLTPQQVLDLPLEENDADASTVREYLAKLAELVVVEDEGFDGKRPFGNSGWTSELYVPLVKAGVVDGTIDVDGYLEVGDYRQADAVLAAAARALAESPALNVAALDSALRAVVEHLDYDVHKQLESDEGTGEDTYHEHVARFVAAYGEALATLAAR